MRQSFPYFYIYVFFKICLSDIFLFLYVFLFFLIINIVYYFYFYLSFIHFMFTSIMYPYLLNHFNKLPLFRYVSPITFITFEAKISINCSLFKFTMNYLKLNFYYYIIRSHRAYKKSLVFLPFFCIILYFRFINLNYVFLYLLSLYK